MNRRKLITPVLLGHLVVCLVTPLLQAAPLSPKNVKVYTTAKDTNKRLTLTQESTFKPGKQATEGEISIFVNPNKRFQKVLGIGGAITDASAEVFAKLPADKQSEMLKAYYDKEVGIGYSLARTPIH